jgi:hypothetical protein
MPFTLWPLADRVRLAPLELAWADRPDDPALSREVWWARWVLDMIGRHPSAWVPVRRLVWESEAYVGRQLSEEAFRVAARRNGARVRPDAVGYDMAAFDRIRLEALLAD